MASITQSADLVVDGKVTQSGTPEDPEDLATKAYVDSVASSGGIAGLNGATGLWIGTEAEYAAIGTPVATVLYAILP